MTIKEKFEDFLKEKRVAFNRTADELKNEGIYHLGIFNVPYVAFSDQRLIAPARMLYIFLSSIADLKEEFSPKMKSIAEVLDMDRETLELAFSHLTMLGYLKKTGDESYSLVQFPKMDSEKIEEQFRKAVEGSGLIEKLEENLQELIELFEGEKTPEKKEQFERIMNKLKQSENREIKKGVQLDPNKNIKAQIFEKISEEIAESIPESADRIRVEIEFETGIAKVEIG